MTLDEAVKAFKKHRGYLRDPLEAKSQCDHISNRFIQFLKDNKVQEGQKARTVVYAFNTARHYPLKVRFVNRDRVFCRRTPGGCYYHVVVRIGPLRIDWTARQFHPDADFPLIWTVKR